MLYFFDETALTVELSILIGLTIILLFQKRSFSYLVCFWVFGLYLIGAIREVIFPIYIRETGSAEPWIIWSNLNWIPLYFGDCQFIEICNRQIIGNILLGVPFGFGISFIVPCKARNFVWLPLAVGLGFEAAQFITSLGHFHALDINDVLLNAAGVWLGYAGFRLFGWLYQAVLRRLQITPWGVFAYFYEVASR